MSPKNNATPAPHARVSVLEADPIAVTNGKSRDVGDQTKARLIASFLALLSVEVALANRISLFKNYRFGSNMV